MLFQSYFFFTTLVTFSYVDYTTAKWILHDSCTQYGTIIEEAIGAAYDLATNAYNRVQTRPWNEDDSLQKEYSQYAQWLLGNSGQSTPILPPLMVPPFPGGPLPVDMRGNLDRYRDNLNGIMGILNPTDQGQWPSAPVHKPAGGGYLAYDTYYPLMPKGAQVFFCDETRLGPIGPLDPTKPNQLYTLDNLFLVDLPVPPDPNPALSLTHGCQKPNFPAMYTDCMNKDFCTTTLCPGYLQFITRAKGIVGLPAIRGRLSMTTPVINLRPYTEIDHYMVMGAVVLHEMFHTFLGGSATDDLGYGWDNIIRVPQAGTANVDNQVYWALTSDLAQNSDLYTHFDGSVNNNHNP